MPEYTGQLRPVGRVALVASRYNQVITGKLLEGALRCCRDAGIPDDQIDVVWAAGAFELSGCCAAAAKLDRYACVVALGAVIRGETPHFEYVSGSVSQGLTAVSVDYALPVGFGVLTVDSLPQATSRAGGAAGNKGYEAAESAIRMADALAALRAVDA
jgi:6,7-dimethyl-8-ribityllumazine synthase